MKIQQFTVENFRTFNQFEFTEQELSNSVSILVGKNGTGKSTLLEIIGLMLGPNGFNEFTNETFAQSVLKNEAKFTLKVGLQQQEIDELRRHLMILDPDDRQRTATTIRETFASKKHFIIEIQLSQNEPGREEKYTVDAKCDGASIPSWLNIAKSNRLLCAYVPRLSSISLAAYQGLQMGHNIPVAGQFLNTQISLDNRNQALEININSILNNLAGLSLTQVFKTQFKSDPSIKLEFENDLSNLNEIIKPLEISYDRDELFATGVFNFRLKNHRLNRSYSINNASSGEKQLISLWWIINVFTKHKLKPILLLDEPDSSLHPEFIDRLGKFIGDTLSGVRNASCIIATHSSELVVNFPGNVFSVDPSKNRIEAINNLDSKIKLFESLGRRFDLAYLAEKIYFVEGVASSNNDLTDREVYQRLVDPTREKALFVPAGNKKVVIQNANMMKLVVENLTSSNVDNIMAIVDSDQEVSEKAILTPYNCLENLFLMKPDLLESFIKENIDSSFLLSDVTGLSLSNPLALDGKEQFDLLHSYLASNFKAGYKGIGKRKGLQSSLLTEIAAQKNNWLVAETLAFLNNLT